MREIKFRAWDSEHKVWRFGWLTQLVEGIRRFKAIICDDEKGDLTRYYIHDEKSIGQYTGLTDKNGVEIYEGDVLRHTWGIETVGEVIFSNGCFTLNSAYRTRIFNEAYFGDCCEVIGNIYDNPELLEEDNE